MQHLVLRCCFAILGVQLFHVYYLRVHLCSIYSIRFCFAILGLSLFNIYIARMQRCSTGRYSFAAYLYISLLHL